MPLSDWSCVKITIISADLGNFYGTKSKSSEISLLKEERLSWVKKNIRGEVHFTFPS